MDGRMDGRTGDPADCCWSIILWRQVVGRAQSFKAAAKRAEAELAAWHEKLNVSQKKAAAQAKARAMTASASAPTLRG